MDEKEFGKLIGKVNAIKENTDKIPELAIAVAVHENEIKSIKPKVARHEKSAQRAIGFASFFGIISGILATMAKSLFHSGG